MGLVFSTLKVGGKSVDTVKRCYVSGRTEQEVRENTRKIELPDINARVEDLKVIE